MGVVVLRRCNRCHEQKSSEEFRQVSIKIDRAGKKHRTYDIYCNACQPFITQAQRRADSRDVRPADR